jgi:uncharacterized Zn finger protein
MTTIAGRDMRRVDDWFDEKSLLDLASPQAFMDGAAAAEHGSVEVLEHHDLRLRSRVAATKVYEAAFWLVGDELRWSCTCGQADERPCEHLVASAFATWPTETPDLH